MKLSLFTAAPVLLLASSTVFAQQAAPAAAPVAPAAAPAVAPAPVADAPATAAAPAPAPVVLDAPAPAPLPPPADLLPPPVPAELPTPTKLGISKEGWWQPGANLQFWAFGANQGGDTATTLRIRRAELRVKGEIIPKFFAFNVMIDPARALDSNKVPVAVTAPGGAPSPGTVAINNQGSVSILQDFFITLQSDYADVTVGQFKIPVSLEGSGSASKLLFPERAIVSRAFGDARDIGIKVDKKIGKNFYYQVDVFNGEGQDKLDSNAQKDLALRLEVYPIDGITLGAVGYASAHNRTTTATTKDRVEGDLKIDIADFILQAEYIHGWDGPTNVARKESAGAYAALGYTIAKTIQPLVRIGAYDANVRADLPGKPGEHGQSLTAPLSAGIADEIVSYELGLNYYLKGNDAKLMASASHFVMKNETNRGELIIGAQAAF